METSILQFVIESCFTKTELDNYFPGESPVQDAVEAILCEDSEGEALMQQLDHASKQQREKIRSMSPRELRSSLSIEFLEPGKRLGLILWALLRDDRLSARSLAGQIVDSFPQTTQPSPQQTVLPASDSDSTVDVIPMENGDNESQEISDDNLDIDDFLADLNSDELEDFSFPSEENEQDYQPSLEDSEEEDGLFTFSDTDEDSNTSDLNHLDEILDHSFDDISQSGKGPDSFEDDDLRIYDEETLDNEIRDIAERASFSENNSENENIPLDLSESDTDSSPNNQERTASFDEEPDEVEPEVMQPSVETGEMISLGGIEICLSSLKKACKKVFQEPVELVSDPNLTENDQLVVVGKNCGVRILHGPCYELRSEFNPEPAPASQPIEVSPDSLQVTLSRIYGEKIELVPDSTLLTQGTILFAGRETGISLINNPSITVPVPDWADQDKEKSIPVSELTALKNRISEIEQALAAISAHSSQTEIPAPPTESSFEHSPVEEQIEEAHIPVDEIEPDVLEPIEEFETLPGTSSLDDISPDELDEDILAAIQEQEKEEQDAKENLSLAPQTAEEDIEALDLDALQEEELDLDALTDDLSDETSEEFPAEESIDNQDILPLTETKETEETDPSQEQKEINLDEIEDEEGLGDLDLDEIDIESLINTTEDLEEEESTTEDEIGGDEIDLESLNLDELTDDESDQELTKDSSPQDLDLDLDVLAELDEDEVVSAPKKVFDGEQILLLGGDPQHEVDYLRIVTEIGGSPEWYVSLDSFTEEEIIDKVNQAHLIMTISSQALSDPGILQATNYAQENNRRLFSHHSANPLSVQKQLIKLVEEGKV